MFNDFRSVLLFPHGLRRRSKYDRKRWPFPGRNDDKSASDPDEKSRRIFPVRGRYVERNKDVATWNCTSEFVRMIYHRRWFTVSSVHSRRGGGGGWWWWWWWNVTTKFPTVQDLRKRFRTHHALGRFGGQGIITMNWLEWNLYITDAISSLLETTSLLPLWLSTLVYLFLFRGICG